MKVRPQQSQLASVVQWLLNAAPLAEPSSARYCTMEANGSPFLKALVACLWY